MAFELLTVSSLSHFGSLWQQKLHSRQVQSRTNGSLYSQFHLRVTVLPWEWQTTNISHLSQLCVAETLLEYLRSLALFSSTHPQLIVWNLHPRYGKLKILGPLCPSPWFAYRMELPLWGGKCRRPEATAPRMSPLQSRTVMLRHQLQRRGTAVCIWKVQFLVSECFVYLRKWDRGSLGEK